jgi:hypothetical protein
MRLGAIEIVLLLVIVVGLILLVRRFAASHQ